MRREKVVAASLWLVFGCGDAARKSEPAPAEQTSPVAESDKVPPEQPPVAEPSPPPTAAPIVEPNPAPTPTAAPNLLDPRFETIACEECSKLESAFAERCLERVHADEHERLGCGEASATGAYAFVVKETGSTESEDWKLSLSYLDASGKVVFEGPGCEDEPGSSCEPPGRFLPIGDGRWLHRQGNAGDGTNDNDILDLKTGERHELPEGEYTLVVHPDRPAVGIFSTVPNLETPDGRAAVRVQIGCFDLETTKLSLGKDVFVPEDEVDPIYVAEGARFEGDELVFTAEGRAPFRHRCKPGHRSSTLEVTGPSPRSQP